MHTRRSSPSTGILRHPHLHRLLPSRSTCTSAPPAARWAAPSARRLARPSPESSALGAAARSTARLTASARTGPRTRSSAGSSGGRDGVSGGQRCWHGWLSPSFAGSAVHACMRDARVRRGQRSDRKRRAGDQRGSAGTARSPTSAAAFMRRGASPSSSRPCLACCPSAQQRPAAWLLSLALAQGAGAPPHALRPASNHESRLLGAPPRRLLCDPRAGRLRAAEAAGAAVRRAVTRRPPSATACGFRSFAASDLLLRLPLPFPHTTGLHPHRWKPLCRRHVLGSALRRLVRRRGAGGWAAASGAAVRAQPL